MSLTDDVLPHSSSPFSLKDWCVVGAQQSEQEKEVGLVRKGDG